jgi:hypothetical protein
MIRISKQDYPQHVCAVAFDRLFSIIIKLDDRESLSCGRHYTEAIEQLAKNRSD